MISNLIQVTFIFTDEYKIDKEIFKSIDSWYVPTSIVKEVFSDFNEKNAWNASYVWIDLKDIEIYRKLRKLEYKLELGKPFPKNIIGNIYIGVLQ